MNLRKDSTWLFVAAGSAVVAAVSAAAVIISAADGNLISAAISAATLILFAACAITAWTIRSRISVAEAADDEVKCLTLKRAGAEPQGETIVPKGKMPKV